MVMIPMAEVIAVTGDIGAGKSTVARLMESYGGMRFDADAVTRNLWFRPDIREAAINRWGKEILSDNGEKDHAIDHAKVAARMFASRIEYEWCCHLLHPLVMAQLAKSVAALSPDHWAIAEIPLLFEVGRPNWANVVLYVTAPYEIRLARCRKRGWDEAELERRTSFYTPAADRIRHSDFVLVNDGDINALNLKIKNTLETILHHSSNWLCWLFDNTDTKKSAIQV